ncbi:MAG: hypothetical protein MJZ67_08750 [Bacteroidales bacterium]|nr:hypothetical protein [Bacteroidales bacterium]
MAFLFCLVLSSCGKESPAPPTFQGQELYHQMLGTHRWIASYDATYQCWVSTWAESYVRFTPDSVHFYHMVQCGGIGIDTTWLEPRSDGSFAYTFTAPDIYTFSGTQYLVQPSQSHPTCYSFWGDGGDGYQFEIDQI